MRDLDEFDATGDEEPEEVEENLSPEELEKREELKYAQLPDPILSPFIPATSSDRYLGNEQVKPDVSISMFCLALEMTCVSL